MWKLGKTSIMTNFLQCSNRMQFRKMELWYFSWINTTFFALFLNYLQIFIFFIFCVTSNSWILWFRMGSKTCLTAIQTIFSYTPGVYFKLTSLNPPQRTKMSIYNDFFLPYVLKCYKNNAHFHRFSLKDKLTRAI